MGIDVGNALYTIGFDGNASQATAYVTSLVADVSAIYQRDVS